MDSEGAREIRKGKRKNRGERREKDKERGGRQNRKIDGLIDPGIFNYILFSY